MPCYAARIGIGILLLACAPAGTALRDVPPTWAPGAVAPSVALYAPVLRAMPGWIEAAWGRADSTARISLVLRRHAPSSQLGETTVVQHSSAVIAALLAGGYVDAVTDAPWSEPDSAAVFDVTLGTPWHRSGDTLVIFAAFTIAMERGSRGWGQVRQVALVPAGSEYAVVHEGIVEWSHPIRPE